MTEATVAPDWIEAGRKLFAGPCEFMFAAARADGLPPVGPPEIAFAGRSNVGKSSLVNALTGRNSLARTSRTPGRTQELIFFDLCGKKSAVAPPEQPAAATQLAAMKDECSGQSSPFGSVHRQPRPAVLRWAALSSM